MGPIALLNPGVEPFASVVPVGVRDRYEVQLVDTCESSGLTVKSGMPLAIATAAMSAS
jgi:hypothetical protein